MIAEESTDWPLVTKPASLGGLGFNYKWNMGWMNDTLKYMQSQFLDRKARHNLLTFSLVYVFSENFILPLSHDEVVHGKKSLISKLPGDYRRKFAGLRVLYLYQICHPGKKLLFMGGEIAQFIEWRYYSALEWFLLDYELHHKYQKYIRVTNNLYRREKSLWQIDHDWRGFEWLEANNANQGILIFLRKACAEEDFLVVLLNFQVLSYEDYRIGVPYPGTYSEILNTDGREFGGSDIRNLNRIKAEAVPWHGKKYSICIKVPYLGGVILKPSTE
jgi:1,4-alpha-glucan branching enzyme